MKNGILICYLLISTSFNPSPQKLQEIVEMTSSSENLFVILIDGFRWQEIFSGADSLLINDEKFTPDTALFNAMYWSGSSIERRKKLMPFFWNVIASKGQLIGNRDLDNKINVSNIYSLSYPGYNEIFTGTTDILISGNAKKQNQHLNVFEFLEHKEEFQGKVAVFSSWDVFPYILNKDRSGLTMNSGYEQIEDKESNNNLNMINAVQEKVITGKAATRYDLLTYITAKEYIKTNKPRVTLIGFGETDDFAHQKRYDLYLQQANQVDKMVGDLWHMVQTMPAYKNKTSFLITTDHGRGNNTKHWSGHGIFINGSSQTWLALLGPHIQPLGEKAQKQQLYSKQLAGTIAKLVGRDFIRNDASKSLSKK